MSRNKVVSAATADPDAPCRSLIGIGAIAAELAAEGVSVDELLRTTGIHPWQLQDDSARISSRQRLAVYRRATQVAKRSDIGLLAGSRQRLSDYGIYGFAMVSSATFGDALEFSLEHIGLAEPMVKEIRLRIHGDTVMLSSHGIESLGDYLPFCAEFWRSSMTTLFSRVLEAPFPSKRMVFPFPAPKHWRNYERLFNCPVDFDGAGMEWHFDASLLDRPCPNANPITTKICQQFCDRMIEDDETVQSTLSRRVRSLCMNHGRHFPSADQIAAELGLSPRTFHRHLALEGASYQGILDDLRRRLAIEFLENTRMRIDEVAERVGFSDATGFRRAFRKWTGESPTHYRSAA
ncbi:MAG: AraC family transcriptional regulator [Sphingomonas sp.]